MTGRTERPHGQALRKGRVSEAGRAYLVTFVTRDRQPVFTDIPMGRLLVHEMHAADREGLTKTWCFCVMPDHCHWLLTSECSSLSRVVGRVKARSAKHIGLGSLWQPGFHDHALRREEDLRTVARYVVANPLRAGLVRHIGDYPLWDAAWL
ncbi:MAG TPA: transposase [Thiobacillaceae bacterium]|nr:transposase [Thiobacillaceae bacterium]